MEGTRFSASPVADMNSRSSWQSSSLLLIALPLLLQQKQRSRTHHSRRKLKAAAYLNSSPEQQGTGLLRTRYELELHSRRSSWDRRKEGKDRRSPARSDKEEGQGASAMRDPEASGERDRRSKRTDARTTRGKRKVRIGAPQQTEFLGPSEGREGSAITGKER
ncbi:hypothetical protein C4D60_Mb04t32600 [Musa balbisiana]|uniref:Uncharacterized protein n=1 Tax=Musa balbisiana TaxID=52838 RepID=A0A4S8KGE6_MUSBA|nr:hypothetical protein C4D60_Mb04t32600 [Musa balbisiana]